MRSIRTIAVYCGSNFGEGDKYREAAAALGRTLAARSIELIYGGTHKGLMGILADAVVDNGGVAHGIITHRLHEKGHLHSRLRTHEVVATMRERKARMITAADAFIALPGGIGTLEEFVEVWTLNQLGEVEKPLGLLNVGGYYDPFMAFIDRMIGEKFLPPAHRSSIAIAAEPAILIDDLKALAPIGTPKWLS